MPSRPEKPDFLETPGVSWRGRKSGWVAYWVARADLVKRGFSPSTARVWPIAGQPYGDAPTLEQWQIIATACNRLHAQMLEWANVPAGEWDPKRVYDGTIDSLIHIFRDDPDSPFRDLRYKTKLAYESNFRTLSVTVGRRLVPGLTFRDFKRWHESFCRPAKEGGPIRTARGHGLMTILRLLIEFGKKVQLEGCAAARETLSDMEFRMPTKRTVFLTADQVNLIRLEAHRRGQPSIALAQALMFDLMLRQKDVLGELVPVGEPGFSIVLYRDRKWMYGIQWSEISSDLILSHRLSKSLKGRDAIADPTAGKLERFDLTAYPMVMEELAHVTNRVGPVVIRENTGRPWDSKSFNRAWRKIANAVGIPRDVQNRDSRAGGITEALDAGAKPDQVRRSAGHSQLSTTMIYSRASLEAKAEVVALRVENRGKTGTSNA